MININKNFHDSGYLEGRLEGKISACIVIPTYNELHNIKALLELLYGKEHRLRCEKENVMMNVLVVDDNSPDGTADAVRIYRRKNRQVHLLFRKEKKGLGAAYIAGMQHAVEILEPDIIFEMDADLSHDPSYVLPMIGEIRKGADFVIGSRYVAGGSIPDDWGIQRRVISRIANFYAKTILRMENVKDCTGGFRAMRSSIFEKIDLSRLDVKGYAFQISLLDAVVKNQFIVKEVPIAFHDRTVGKSKMRISDIIEVGTSVLRMALSRSYRNTEALESEEAVFREEPEVAHSLIKP